MGRFFYGPISNRFVIPMPYVSYQHHVRASTAQLVDVSLFRHVPHFLKRRIYNQQEWFLQ